MSLSSKSDVSIRGDSAALASCGHFFTLKEWQKYLGDDFNGVGGRRKKPLIAFTCPKCKSSVSANAFVELCDEPTRRRFDAMMSTVPRQTCHPKSLADFNYAFNAKGQLETRDGGYTFHYVSETHYVWLGNLIQKEIERLMVERYGLVEHRLPEGGGEDSPKTSIFASPDVAERDHVLLLIQVLSVFFLYLVSFSRTIPIFREVVLCELVNGLVHFASTRVLRLARFSLTWSGQNRGTGPLLFLTPTTAVSSPLTLRLFPRWILWRIGSTQAKQ